MGFRLGRKVYHLIFEDGYLDGLRIEIEALTLGELKALKTLQSEKTLTEREEEEFRCLIERVTGWNLEDENGAPLPITYESFRDLPSDDARYILRTWYRRCIGADVPAPLEKPSTDGGQLRVESIPMETLTPNQQS